MAARLPIAATILDELGRCVRGLQATPCDGGAVSARTLAGRSARHTAGLDRDQVPLMPSELAVDAWPAHGRPDRPDRPAASPGGQSHGRRRPTRRDRTPALKKFWCDLSLDRDRPLLTLRYRYCLR